ncbi:MAG: hypothetical protein ACKOAU_21045 [Pirellula sp.]
MTDQKGIEIALVARAASIRFTKSKDRYDHRFVVKIADQQIPLLESYLQDPLAPWPTDPAIQQLVVEPIGSTPYPDVALGVGMSGKGHWSLATQWIETADGRSAIELDYACKQTPPVEFLGSSYQIANLLTPEIRTTSRYEVSPNRWSGWFSSRDEQDSHKLVIDVLEGHLEWDAETLRIRIRPEGTCEKPSTLRWCYRIAWLSCHE